MRLVSDEGWRLGVKLEQKWARKKMLDGSLCVYSS